MWTIVSSLDCDTFAETTSCILSFRYYYSLYILHNAHKQAAVTSARGKLEQTVTHILYFKHCNYYNLIIASFHLTKHFTIDHHRSSFHFTFQIQFDDSNWQTEARSFGVLSTPEKEKLAKNCCFANAHTTTGDATVAVSTERRTKVN